MDWVKPEFGEFLCPPRKRQKVEDPPGVSVKKTDIDNLLSEVSTKLNLVAKYCPKNRNELVVNKKKIEEVEYWLTNIENENPYLLITGPPGCGKFRTFCVLCKSLEIDVVEWVSPISHSFDPDNYNPFYQNELQGFEAFILRASRYSNVLSLSSKRVIVVKDIPNGFIRNSSLFHTLLENYFRVDKIRIAFIISEFSLCRDLFPENVKMNFFVKTINFNPITERNVTIALQNLVKKFELQKINSNIGKYIDQISSESKGDLRNALATLQFFLVKGNLESINLPMNRKKKVKGVKTKPEAVVNSNTTSDSKIDIFHGLGRILYAKRVNGKLVHNPQDIADHFITCPQLLIGMLHENYVNTFSSVHDISKASNSIATSDLLLRDWDSNSSVLGSGVSVASHGVIIANSNPIKKFQQFNKNRMKQDSLLQQYKYLLESSHPSWKGSDILMDLAPYVNNISHFESPHKDLILKLGNFS